MKRTSSSGLRSQRSRRYLLGMGGVALLCLGLIAFAPAEWRPGLWLALGLALPVQILLGVWLLDSLGSERFMAVWVLGMLIRLVLTGIAALVLFPALHWPAAPGLLTLVLLWIASLAVEGGVLLLEFREAETR